VRPDLSLLFILSAAEILEFSTDVSWRAQCVSVRLERFLI
jgi:hypothetical protein